MRLKTSFSHITQRSPPQSYKDSFKENNQSINFNLDSRIKASVSTHHQCSQRPSSDNLYTLRLESRILEMQKKIDHQKFQMDTLTLETQNYMILCEEQKRQLSSLNIEMLRQQYEEQISDLLAEKEKLTGLIQNISEDYQKAEMEQEAEITSLKATNLELANQLEEAMNRKERLLRDIAAADAEYALNVQRLSEQEQRIDGLRNIDRKLLIAMRELEALKKHN